MPNSSQEQLLRRETIRELLLRAPADTQQALVDELNDRGLIATQSSVSRDLKDLGAIKTGKGYELPDSGSTTDDEARKLIDDYLAIQRDRVALRRSYVEPFAEALSGRKLMRFYQIENKIDAVMRYELAASIPVIEQ